MLGVTRHAAGVVLAITLLAAGCCRVSTQVLVELDASPEIRARAHTLRIEVFARSGEVIATNDVAADREDWGAQPLVPADESTLEFHVAATALDADGVAIATGSLRGTYERCQRIARPLVLMPISETCAELEDGSPCPGAVAGTCRGGECCTGCWDGTSCVTSPTTSRCGAGGALCIECTGSTPLCESGTCAPDPCASGADGDPCPGGRCVEGACCTTCAVGGRCQALSNATCGSGGALCSACVAPADACDARGECIATRAVVSIGISAASACLVDRLGDLWCWGNGSAGQVGIAGWRQCCRTSPALVEAGRGQWRSVDVMNAEWGHACGIQAAPGASGGSLWCWGNNADRAVGDPTAMGSDGSTSFIDAPFRIGVEGLGDEWESVAGGSEVSCALHLGRLYCWGWNSGGRVGLSRADHTGDYVERPRATDGTYGRIELAYGNASGCAIEADGSLVCWGDNQRGQLGPDAPPLVPPRIVFPGTRWRDVALGALHTCGIREGDPFAGTMWCWGSNDRGQLGVDASTSETSEPLQVGTESDWTSVSADGESTCAIRGRSLWCWGDNDEGHLGIGMEATALPESFTPVQLRPEIEWTLVEVGGRTSCAVDVRGVMWCWGRALSAVTGDHAIAPEEVQLRE
jgi:alpha-tubulin suppressor-like RCC1 family protein